MSSFVGIDLSTKALDLVKLDEDTNRAEWVRCELVGKTAWERTLSVYDALRDALPPVYASSPPYGGRAWFEDVVLLAIEAPMGYGSNKLDRVVGAVAASLPAHLRAPARCWVVQPQEWKTALGIPVKSKPTEADIYAIAAVPCSVVIDAATDQNARDAYCIAWWARQELHKAIAA